MSKNTVWILESGYEYEGSDIDESFNKRKNGKKELLRLVKHEQKCHKDNGIELDIEIEESEDYIRANCLDYFVKLTKIEVK